MPSTPEPEISPLFLEATRRVLKRKELSDAELLEIVHSKDMYITRLVATEILAERGHKLSPPLQFEHPDWHTVLDGCKHLRAAMENMTITWRNMGGIAYPDSASWEVTFEIALPKGVPPPLSRNDLAPFFGDYPGDFLFRFWVVGGEEIGAPAWESLTTFLVDPQQRKARLSVSLTKPLMKCIILRVWLLRRRGEEEEHCEIFPLKVLERQMKK